VARGRSGRIPPVLGLVAEGWTLQSALQELDGGAHGYDNRLQSMSTVFVGWVRVLPIPCI
jgi:hypothetical protein